MGIDTPAPPVGRVLDLDPDLGSGIGAADWEKARRACRAPVLQLGPGVWERGERVGGLGMVIVEGMLCREVSLGEHHMFELLGPGDVVALPEVSGGHRLGGPDRLTAASETILIGLGEQFVRASARWPCLLEAVLGRLDAQRERLARQGLIAHLRRAEDRMLMVLWLLADRWGQSTPEGTVLSLALTHELLGQLTASRRSTATVAVGTLEASGAIRRLADGSWLLTAAADGQVSALACESAPAAGLGEGFMLRQLVVEASLDAQALRAEARQARARHRSGQRARSAAGKPSPDARASERDNGPVIDCGNRDGRAARAASAAQLGASAADVGADAARRRARDAARRKTELADQRAPSTYTQNAKGPGKWAAARAASAARSAQAAQARASRAHRRVAEALENAAAKHEHAAERAAAAGDRATATWQRELAELARKDAQRARALEDS